MFDLEKLIFDETFPLAVAQTGQAEQAAFLAQKKLESRLTGAVADFAEKLALDLKKRPLSPVQQQSVLQACAGELRSLMGNPQALAWVIDSGQEQDLPAGIADELRIVYAFVWAQLAKFLAEISAKVSEAADQRSFEKAVVDEPITSEPTRSANPSRSVEKSAPDNYSFDIPMDEAAGASAAEPVSFTAMYPREIGVEVWNTLLVYTHLASALASIQKDAQRFKDQLGDSKEVTAPASTPLARGTELTIVPQCEGVVFNPTRITLAWLEDFHRTEFRFRADRSLIDDAARGRIDIYVGPLIVGTLKLALLVGENPPPAAPQEAEHANMYSQDDIFISYSHRDTEIVSQFKKAYEAIGNNILIDIDTLRSGQDWNAELLKMIDRAEIFQLFWSESSSQSQYCRQEWEYALKLNKGTGFIRPCYWQEPLPMPPAELGHLHFEYIKW